MKGALWPFQTVEGTSVKVDGVLALVGVGTSILLIPLVFLTDEIFVLLVPVAVGGGCLVYLVTRQHARKPSTQSPYVVGRTGGRGLETAVIFGLGALALVAGASGHRSLVFHVLSSAIGSVILVQVLFVHVSELRPLLVLGEILGLLLTIQFTALLTTPGFVGVDTWIHITQFATAIQGSGTTAAIADSKYSTAPLYHLLVVNAGYLFDSTLRTALFASVSILVSVSPLLVYHTARYVLSVRWSLLAAALFAMSDYMLRWSIDVIPNSMGLVLFAAVVFAVVKLFYTKDRVPVYALALYFGLATVLTHQVSAFIVLTFLGAGVVGKLFDEHTAYLTGTVGRALSDVSAVNTIILFVGTSAIAVGNWLTTPYGSQHFVGRMLVLVSSNLSSAGFLQLRGASEGPIPLSESVVTTTPFAIELLDAIGFSTLLFLTVLGVLVLVQTARRNQLSVTLVVSIGVMLAFTLGLPLFGVNVFIPDRWFAFIYALMAFVSALGLRYVTRQGNSRAVVAGLLVLVLVFPGSMMLAQKATLERPAFGEVYPKYAYTNSELAAAESIAETYPEAEEPVVTDHPYRMIFELRHGRASTPIQFNQTDGTLDNSSVVYRRYQSSGAPVVAVGDTAIRVQLPRNRVCPSERAVVYDNGAVTHCRSLPV